MNHFATIGTIRERDRAYRLDGVGKVCRITRKKINQSLTAKNITDRFNFLKRNKKLEETDEGFKGEFKGFIIERKILSRNKSYYRILVESNS